MSGGGIHQAFQLRPGTDPLKIRIESIDVNNNILCYGDTKGIVQLCKIDITETDFNMQELVSKKVILSIQEL